MNSKYKLQISMIGLGLGLVGFSAMAQTVSVGTTTPLVGDGVQYLGDSGSAASGNVTMQFVSSSYIAGDNNACLGQTFTTGANASGYYLNSFSFMQVANYSTWWQINGNTSFGYRLFSTGTPVQDGYQGTYDQPISVLQNGSVNFSSSQPGGVQNANPAGVNALWVTITLASPMQLSANTQYGFDLLTDGTGGNSDFFMEWNGVNGANSTFTGGQAIVDGSANNPAPTSVFLGNGPGSDNTTLAGSRTFVASMTAVAPVPEPSTMALAGLGGLALLVWRQKTKN